MHLLVTGGTGTVGRFVVAAARAAGHRVTLLGRGADAVPWDLADRAPRLPAADALVHAALHHAPGAYRGGEGDDPAGFRRLNVDGTRAVFDAAGDARIVFLSSRAVYGDRRRGEVLREEDPPAPDTLYGEVKLAGEAALAGRGVALRPTGVYGGSPHKWEALFAAYLRGDVIPPRLATEVHGADLAAAVLLVLERPAAGACNVSDVLLDRHDLLARVRALTGCTHPPPPRFAGSPPGVMATGRLRALGWRPGGLPRLEAFLAGEFGNRD
jgi:nucleoside-diphosphate-sugar epimerase